MDNPKGILIERLQGDGRAKPKFETRSSGPDHEPIFESDVLVDGEVIGSGSGGSKRDAERQAANVALAALDSSDASDESDNGAATLPFEGPWPLFEGVLAASISVANDRIDAGLKGEAAVDAVHELALRIYKGVLEDLADVVEIDEEA